MTRSSKWERASSRILRDDANRLAKIAREHREPLLERDPPFGPPLPTPKPPPAVVVVHHEPEQTEAETDLGLRPDPHGRPLRRFSEAALRWLRSVRDRNPGSPLEEGVALAEAYNSRIDRGVW